MEHKKYPSINNFKSVVKEIKKSTSTQLDFTGTVKIHGTNASIVKLKDSTVYFQSRTKVLSLVDDNYGFMNYMIDKDLSVLFKDINFTNDVVIYGEWCGGNIQQNVGIENLNKMFVVFSVMVDNVFIKDISTVHDNSINIYNINQFEQYKLTIDVNKPYLSIDEIIKVTNDIENDCPVSKYFGIKGIGEGVVFTCNNDSAITFKSKGVKHSKSKVINLLTNKDVDSLSLIDEAVYKLLTDTRLEQGISYLKENNILVNINNTKIFLDWVILDIKKEEENYLPLNITEKIFFNCIGSFAVKWFKLYLTTN